MVALGAIVVGVVRRSTCRRRIVMVRSFSASCFSFSARSSLRRVVSVFFVESGVVVSLLVSENATVGFNPLAKQSFSQSAASSVALENIVDR